MIKVLVVDDSPTARRLLVQILEKDPDIEVAGTADNGKEGVELSSKLKPDIITMDVNMPVMNGIEAIRTIMKTDPRPILIVTGIWDPESARMMFKAVEMGALSLMEKPPGPQDPDFKRLADELIRRVKVYSEVKVVKRRTHPGEKPGKAPKTTKWSANAPLLLREKKLIAIGASAGGPAVLKQIFRGLPKEFPLPILLVQHIGAGFLDCLVDWLADNTPLVVKVASNGEPALPGHIYIAPCNYQMGINPNGRITVNDEKPEHNLKPSVDYTMRSVAEAFGSRGVGIVLTGMGSDGADGLLEMKKAGALTIAQDHESSTVYGMPKEAAANDAAVYELSPEEILKGLTAFSDSNKRRR